MAKGRFEIDPMGPYSLASSVRFLEGFAPASYEGGGADHLRLAFVAEGFAERGERVTGAYVYSEGDRVVGEAFGEADPEVVREQVGRILSLDIDGSGFTEVGRQDPVVGRLQVRYPGLRPVLFYSPYEAAAWALVSHRIYKMMRLKVVALLDGGIEVSGIIGPAEGFSTSETSS